ncbi:MAG: FUSC family membrane protein [Parafilimonas sp.]
MDYGLTLKRIISSQYLYKGLRITAAVIVPALILYHYNILAITTAIPLGALVVSLTDNPGPFHHRRNALLIAICINFLVVVLTIFINHNPWFIVPAIIVFGIFFTMIGIYGNRANSIGLIALFVFIFNIDSKASFSNAWLNGLLFTAGGLWYFVMSMLLHTLRPYRYIQQQMGESISALAEYMQSISELLKPQKNYREEFSDLGKRQIIIIQQQDSLREVLLDTRQMVIDSTVKGRTLMMMFLDNIDLFEQILTLHQDYSEFLGVFKDDEIIKQLNDLVEAYTTELKAIGLAVQYNESSNSNNDIDELLKNLFTIFSAERKRSLSKTTLTLFIRLRQIVYAVQDIGERIKRLHRYTRYDKKISRQYQRDNNSEMIVQPREISPQLFIENLTLKSGHFRHAIRITLAMLSGYVCSLLFPVGHGYWILLTIVTILKPAYSISRTRNAQRLLGTVTGVVTAFIFLYFVTNSTLAFFVMLVTMIVAYSLLSINYYISSTCITIFVLISIHLLNSSNFTSIIKDRMIDTAAGCVIAFLISLFVLPFWQYEQIGELIKKALIANRNYFNVVCIPLTKKNADETIYSSTRKDVFVALANLSDSFQKMLSEPKRVKEKTSYYQQFVASNQMLVAQIATLSSFIKNLKINYPSTDFEPIINNINNKFKSALNIVEDKPAKKNTVNKSVPLFNKVQMLFQQRQNEIEHGLNDTQTEARITLRHIKSITDEFELIDSIVMDEIKIAQRIVSNKKAGI